jgi:hypothetical protein
MEQKEQAVRCAEILDRCVFGLEETPLVVHVGRGARSGKRLTVKFIVAIL